ncbi:MAG TPA: hypothetical protein VLV82_07015, partial [Candidatus Angelobacter sp.]|nr:hypothetical protein [Candidatus Angelobacter sp.]
ATDVYRAVYFAGPGNRARVRHDHADLLVALRARDVRRAVAVQKAHRDGSVAAVTRAIEGRPGSAVSPPASAAAGGARRAR